jgi:hypothetical protein
MSKNLESNKSIYLIITVKNRKKMSNKWQKGQSGNPTGRPEGVKNKSTQKIRESIQLIVENNVENIQESLDLMNPKDKMKFIIDLIKLVLPTLRSVDQINSVSENKPSVDFRSFFNFKEPENSMHD